MIVIEFLKNLFKRNQYKLLAENNKHDYSDITESNQILKDNFDFSTTKTNIENKETTKSEKIITILKSIGCNKEIFKNTRIHFL